MAPVKDKLLCLWWNSGLQTLILSNTNLSFQVIGFCSVAAFSEDQEGFPPTHTRALPVCALSPHQIKIPSFEGSYNGFK